MSDMGAGGEELRHRQVQANGLQFHVVEAGAGDRLALCLHGFPELWISWRNQIPGLVEEGWRVWVPDLRGYGETDAPPRVEDYSIETLMEDVGALIDASGAREVMLIAHDWGAIVAWFFAIRQIRPLERLVIMNVPHPGAASSRERNWKQWLRSWYIFFFQLPWLPEFLLTRNRAALVGNAFTGSACHPDRFPDEVLDQYRQAALRPGRARGMVNYYRALVRGGGALRQSRIGFPLIEVPTLFIWGEQDIALTKETTFGTEDFVADLTLRYLPDASHWVQQDQPEIVNEMLRCWLAGEEVPEAHDPRF